MRAPVVVMTFAAAIAAASIASAQPKEPPAVSPEEAAAKLSAPGKRRANVAEPVPDDAIEFSDKLVLDTGRYEHKAPDPTTIGFTVHGEYQLRYRAANDLRLEPPIRDASINKLGQNQYLYHWFRVGARFQIRDFLAIVGQIDVPRGMIAGDSTQRVEAAWDSFSKPKWYEIHPRYLYLEYTSPIGTFRVGQQGSYWGMGILANDGDHPTLFGDRRRGALVERVLFATTPMGKGTPLAIAIGGDLVFEDNTADLLDRKDRAFQGVAAVVYRTKPAEIGLYGVVRHQQHNAEATGSLTPFVENLTVGVVDLTGKFNARIPGTRAFAFGQFEAAAIFGSTTFLRGSYVRPIDPTVKRVPEKVQAFGGSALLGAVHVAGQGDEQWGAVAGELEVGYASGDADPTDGVNKRFLFDQNHNVGLVLFNHVMAWKTARAATIAQDPDIVARAAPGLQLLPSNGGVFGAMYVNPRIVIRPRRWFDIKAGVVIAQATADVVDPYHVGALGNFANYDGGDPRKRDLGIELDLGFDVRIPIEGVATIQIGAEGGALFPGRAFDNAVGERLPNQYLANTKLGLLY